MSKTRLGHVEKLVLGLCAIHSGVSSRLIAEELGRDETYISDVMSRLQDKGLLDQSNQPTARKQPTSPPQAI